MPEFAEPCKLSERFVIKVAGVVSLDHFGKATSRRNDRVGRSDGWG